MAMKKNLRMAQFCPERAPSHAEKTLIALLPGGRWRLMRYLPALLAFASVFCTARGSDLKLPPFVPLSQRTLQSDVVVLGDISNIRSREINKNSVSINMRVRVIELLKGSVDKDFALSFLVFPQTLESNLREPPAEGRYIIFLQKKKVEEVNDDALVLYWPHPFAFVKPTPESLEQVRSAAKR